MNEVTPLDKYLDKLSGAYKKAVNHFCTPISHIKFKKRAVPFYRAFLYAAVLLAFSPLFLLNTAGTVSAYEVSLDGSDAGAFVMDNDLLSKYSSITSIKLTQTQVQKTEVLPISQLEEMLVKKQEVKQPTGYEIKVEGYSGKRLVFSSKEEIDSVLKALKDKYSTKKTYENEQITEVKVKDNYIVQGVFDTPPFVSVNEALQIITTGTDEKKTYKLQQGDSISSIAKKVGLSQDSIIKANPQIAGRETKLQIGEEISLIVPKPLITVEVHKKASYDEKIPFETKTVLTDQEYKTFSKVTVKGEEGIANLTANIVEENGVVNTSRTEVLERNVVKAPVAQEELKGTLQVPPKRAMGSFIKPVASPYISSGFGGRDGSFHYGIDMPKPIGTPVYASDGGVVAEICTNRYADTGLMIRINHENGYQTRYMHLSEISISTGERVYQGQKIGAVGNTGNSTGAHLHFEILKNNVNINPAPLLGM